MTQLRSASLPLHELVVRVKNEKIPVASHSGKVSEDGIFVVLPAAVPQRDMATTPGGEQYLGQVAEQKPAFIVVEERLVPLVEKSVPGAPIPQQSSSFSGSLSFVPLNSSTPIVLDRYTFYSDHSNSSESPFPFPKVELHIHLDGAIRFSTLLELSKYVSPLYFVPV